MKTFTKPSIFSAVIAICVVLGTVVYFTIHDSDGIANFKVKIGSSEVAFNVNKDNSIDVKDLLSRIFSEESRKDTTILIGAKYGLRAIDDPALITKIKELPGNDITSIRLRELLTNLQGPFKRKFHSFYDIQSMELGDAIAQLNYNDRLSQKIRRLLRRSQGPFNFPEKKVKFLIKENPSLEHNIVAVCPQSDFYLESLLVTDEQKTNLATVTAGARIPIGCTPEVEEIQISEDTAKILFAKENLHNENFGFAKIAMSNPIIEMP
jgi:hypothetical protein